MKKLKQIVILLAVTLFCASCSNLPVIENNPWQLVNLPTEVTLSDISFTDDLNHGWLVGSQSTLLETTDGGSTWNSVELELDNDNIRFNEISFFGQEGWVVGEPATLLHTEDGGASWSQIPLSPKLPGVPYTIVATGPDSAEMATDLCAIYTTTDGGRSWQALVQQAIGDALNISRSRDGKYIAVSSRGNFFSVWKPGESAWTPHQRTNSRRLQNMGFAPGDKFWLLANGGQVQFSEPDDADQWEDPIYPDPSGWGLLDITYRTPEELWISGGGGSLLRSLDGGNTWEKDREVDEIPADLYSVVFITPEQGFILGNQGTLLKYEPVL